MVDPEVIEKALLPHVEDGSVAGLVWVVAEPDGVQQGALGRHRVDTGEPMDPAAVFRISSMTKPITAAAVMALVDDGVLALDDPVDELLPELADRRVLVPGATSLDQTEPAERPITVDDVLTFRLGWGADFSDWSPDPVQEAFGRLGLGAGPPAPAGMPPVDEWIRRLGTLPLQHQPGRRWLYHVGSEVAGVLVARAAGVPFHRFLRERLLEPLGMVDTGFHVPADRLDRLGPCYGPSAPDASGTGDGPGVYDDRDGQWASPPPFPSGGAGLVSTAADFLAFARMLLAGGVHDGQRVLSAAAVGAMTTNRLTPEQVQRGGLDPSGALGWGLGTGVHVTATALAPAGAYGWSGGLGTAWTNVPSTGTVSLLLTNTMWSSPQPPGVVTAFWSTLAAA